MAFLKWFFNWLLSIPLPKAWEHAEMEYLPPMPSTDNSITEVPITVPPAPPTPPVEALPPPGTKKNYLNLFCSAIRDFEGAPGDLSYRNNNPGNFRCSPVGYAAMYGAVKCVNAFAVFPTYDLGWKYLENSVLYRAKVHPTWDIMDFFLNYSPPGDNNPTEKYARYVAGRCGVSIDTKLSELFG